MLLCALFLGEGLRMTVLLVSVTLHELSHVAAALALHVPVAELELMPCGGAARFEQADGRKMLNGCIFEIDRASGKTVDTERRYIEERN